MRPILSTSDYHRSIDEIRQLKHRMWMLASQRGNLDPEVIRISQEIDEHIVSVQHYWKEHSRGEALIG